MIAHMSYVMCNVCGDPAQCADDALEARALAKVEGFVRDAHGRDLCKRCKPNQEEKRDD